MAEWIARSSPVDGHIRSLHRRQLAAGPDAGQRIHRLIGHYMVLQDGGQGLGVGGQVIEGQVQLLQGRPPGLK